MCPTLSIRCQVYIAAVQDVHSLVDRLREEWAVPGLKLHETTARGYHLVMPAETNVRGRGRSVCAAVNLRAPRPSTRLRSISLPPLRASQPLPAGLVQPVFTKTKVAATTDELASLSDRIKVG